MLLIGEEKRKKDIEEKHEAECRAFDNAIAPHIAAAIPKIGVGPTSAILCNSAAYLISMCDDDDVITTMVNEFVNKIAIFKAQRDQAQAEKEAINAHFIN